PNSSRRVSVYAAHRIQRNRNPNPKEERIMANIFWKPAGDAACYGTDVTPEQMEAMDALMVEFITDQGHHVTVGQRTNSDTDHRECDDPEVDLPELFAEAWDYAVMK